MAAVMMMCLCLAMAGYVINDIRDRAIDIANRRYNPVSAGHVSNQQAYRTYLLLTIFGAMTTVFLAWKFSLHFLWIYALAATTLWLYSAHFKSMPLIGNLVVSVFCAFVIWILWWPAMPALTMPVQILVLGGFAFVLTWAREMIKDLEDRTGDRSGGAQTLAVVAGARVVKPATALLHAVALIGLYHYDDMLPGSVASLIFWVVTSAGLILGMYWISRANDKSAFHRISILQKAIMITGTMYFLLQ